MRNEFHISYRCINVGKSLNSLPYSLLFSLWVIRLRLQVDKIPTKEIQSCRIRRLCFFLSFFLRIKNTQEYDIMLVLNAFQHLACHEFKENTKKYEPFLTERILKISPNLPHNILLECFTCDDKRLYQLKIWRKNICRSEKSM